VSERLGSVALILALVAVGGAGWWIQLQPPLEVEASALATLPAQIDGWSGRELPVESTVEAILRADFNLQRAYLHATGELVWLYVGYYGTARGGRPEHTPRGCYTGAGWQIEASRTLDVVPGGALRATEYQVERKGERRLVHFWFRSHRRTGMVDGLDQNLDRLLGRLLEGRADGALVRISTPLIDEDAVGARARLLGFAAALDPLIGERWPEEWPGENG
jgi:EpsI family protein